MQEMKTSWVKSKETDFRHQLQNNYASFIKNKILKVYTGTESDTTMWKVK